MPHNYNTLKKKPIVVACSMDFDRDEYLVRQAGRLARQLKLPVHLVHSLEPFKYMHWRGAQASDAASEENPIPSGNVFRKALSGLNELSELMRAGPSELDVTANVLSGPPADAIAIEATAIDAILIIVGSADETKILSGLSTTRELLTTSSIPVLIINDDCIADFSGENLSILIADSLHNDAIRPLETASNLASKSEHGLLIHAHVQSDHQSFIQRFILSPLSRMLPGSIPGKLAAQTSASLMSQVKERAERVGGNPNYLPVVVAGEPQEALLDLADKFSADIIVFGRHRMLHLDSLTLGRVSTAGMLSHKSAVMVVPA